MSLEIKIPLKSHINKTTMSSQSSLKLGSEIAFSEAENSLKYPKNINNSQSSKKGKTIKKTGKSLKSLDKFLIPESTKQPKILENTNETQRIYKLYKCLKIRDEFIKNTKRKVLKLFKFHISQNLKTAKTFTIIHEITETTENIITENEKKLQTLCKGLNRIAKYKMKKELDFLIQWRLYNFYVKRIDPDIFSPLNLNPQNNEMNENNENSEDNIMSINPNISRVKEICSGLKCLNRTFKKQTRYGFSKILNYSMNKNENSTKYIKKQGALSIISKYISRSILPYFTKWRLQTKKSNLKFISLKVFLYFTSTK